MLPTQPTLHILPPRKRGIYAVPVEGRGLSAYIPEPCSEVIRLSVNCTIRLPDDLQKRLLHSDSKKSKTEALGKPLISFCSSTLDDLSPYYAATREILPHLIVTLRGRAAYKSSLDAWNRSQRKVLAHKSTRLDEETDALNAMEVSDTPIVADSNADLFSRRPQRDAPRTRDLRITLPPKKPELRSPRGSNPSTIYLSSFQAALIRSVSRRLMLPVSTLCIAGRFGINTALSQDHLSLAGLNRAVTQSIALQHDLVTALPALTGSDGAGLRCSNCNYLMSDH